MSWFLSSLLQLMSGLCTKTCSFVPIVGLCNFAPVMCYSACFFFGVCVCVSDNIFMFKYFFFYLYILFKDLLKENQSESQTFCVWYLHTVLILMFILWGLLLRYFLCWVEHRVQQKTRMIVHLGSYHSFFSSSVVGQWWDYTSQVIPLLSVGLGMCTAGIFCCWAWIAGKL